MAIWLQLQTTAAAAMIALAALGLGAPVAAGLNSRAGGRRRQIAWEMTIGLVVAGTLLTWLGLCGVLRANVIAVATFIAAIAGLWRLRDVLQSSPRRFESVEVRPNDERPYVPSEIDPALRRVLIGAAVVAAVCSWIAAAVPPTAGDALCYHLNLPKLFLESGRLDVPIDDDNAAYPLLAEMWFAWALALDGPVATQLVHWLCGLLTAGCAAVLAAPIVGRAGAAAVVGLVLIVPGMNNQMTAPLNDAAMAMLTTAATAAWLMTQRSQSSKGYVVVGLLLGGALAVKHTAILFALSAAAVVGITIWREPARRRVLLAGALAATIAAIIVAGPWYARSYFHRGDPVYPFLSRHAEAAGPAVFPEAKTPLGRDSAALFAAPWSMTMEPERFGGRGHQLGPLLLMFAPFVLLLSRRRDGAALLLLCGGYAIGCLLLRQNLRFLLPVVPAAAVTIVVGLQQLAVWPRWPARLAVGATVAVVVLLAAIPMQRAMRHAAAAVGVESREAYLAEREPTSALGELIDQRLPTDARLLSQEMRLFYLPRDATRESIFRRRTAYDRTTPPGRLSETLREHGFSHVLLAEVEGSPTAGYDATLATLIERESTAVRDVAAGADAGPRLVFETRGRDADATVRRYLVFELR